MHHIKIILSFLILVCWHPGFCADTNETIRSQPIFVARIDNQIINPTAVTYLSRAIREATDAQATCLIIELDTPGGLLESTHQIVREILNASIPVVVYISPKGGRAGSAGVFITYASHVAAMAPSTRIGAAHPVNLMSPSNAAPSEPEPEAAGQESPEHSQEQPSPVPTETIKGATPSSEAEEISHPLQKLLKHKSSSALDDKILNDTLAWIESIAKERNRSQEFARASVIDSQSITENEALNQRVVEIIAHDLNDLVNQLDGREISLNNSVITLKTKHKTLQSVDMKLIEKILDKMSHPQVAYYLFLLGILGLVYEFTHPGFGFPGTAGGICLLLGLYSFQTLPVNYVGLALILFGVVLSIVEFFTPTFGLLGLGGFISFVIGSLMLIDSDLPFLKIGLISVLGTGLVLFSLTLSAIYLAFKSIKKHAVTGKEGLIGQTGEVIKTLNPKGKISVHGEIWNAVVAGHEQISTGHPVKIVSMEGLLLTVEPVFKGE